MISDRLAVERAAWSVSLKQEFTAHALAYREHVNDYQNVFVITHSGSPGWKAKVTVCSAHRARNRVELNDAVFSYSNTLASRDTLCTALMGLRRYHDDNTAKVKDKEHDAATWRHRQHAEMAVFVELKGVDVEIIKSGPHAGCYEITLQPGHALEHLTLEQFKVFHAFVRSLKA